MVTEYAEICNDNKCNFYFIFILFHKYPIIFPFKRMNTTLPIVQHRSKKTQVYVS